MKLGGLFKTIGTALAKHEGTILTVGSIGGTLAAVYFAAKDSPKLIAKLDELRERDASNLEKVKEVAPIVARTAIATGVAIGCSIANHKYASNAIQMLTNAYQMKAIAEGEYKKKTAEIAGEETSRKIDEAVSLGHATKSYSSGAIDHVLDTGHGSNLFYDDWSGTWFYSDINFIKKCVNDLNYQLMNDMSVSLNEFYGYLDLPNACGKHAERSGWNIDDGQIRIEYYAQLDDCDQAYTVLSFRNEPRPNYFTARW